MNRFLVIAAAATGVMACSHHGKGVTGPSQLCRAGAPASACRAVTEVEAMLQRDDLEIVAAAPPPAGKQGARVLTLRAPGAEPVVFRAKWRAHSTTAHRNYPRYELAAYSVQKLFLDPEQYVVPPAAAHCFPLEVYRARVDRTAQPTFPGTRCVYGVLQYWLEGVEAIADASADGWFRPGTTHLLDPALFERNPAYRDSVAHANLFAYVFRHADSHARNFVIAPDEDAPVVYAVDNSLALGMRKNRKLSPGNDLSELRVPALPRRAIDRLRSAAYRIAMLGAIARLVLRDGQLVMDTTTGATPARVGWDGTYLTVGLTADEIELMRGRITALLERVDRGEIRLYE